MSFRRSATASPLPAVRQVGDKHAIAQSSEVNDRELSSQHNTSFAQPTRSHVEDAEHDDHNDISNISSDEEEIEKRRVRYVKRSNTLSKAYTEDEEKTVIQKFDRRLVLFLAFLYLLSFLDRSNIGNARIAGLEKALQLSDVQFDYCLVAFYVTYITFEWMILLYRLVPAHIYISLCVLAWGIVASLQSVVTSFRQLLALRACLGITEAAFGPGVPFYMTFFYRRSELAYRVGLQISAAPLATSFASSLAWLIIKLSQNSQLEPWRALFLFEGFPSIVTAIFAFYYIPDSPETARYLTPRQRKVASLRLQDDQCPENPSGTHTKHHKSCLSLPLLQRLRNSTTIKTLSSPLPWLQALIFLGINVSFASLPVFLPTIIYSMSFSPLTSQILSAPPYLLSFAFVLFIGRLSDSIPDSRGICLMSCASLSAVSYFIIALFGALEHSGVSEGVSIIVRYIAVYGAAMGLFSCVVLIITWNLNNQAGKKEKGLAMMVMNVVGQCGPLIGVNLFPADDGPHFVKGMTVSGCFMVGVVALAGILRFMLVRKNMESEGKGLYEMMEMHETGVSGAGEDEGEHAAEEAEGLIANDTAPRSQRQPGRANFEYML